MLLAGVRDALARGRRGADAHHVHTAGAIEHTERESGSTKKSRHLVEFSVSMKVCTAETLSKKFWLSRRHSK
jgi:hypothetical protein